MSVTETWLNSYGEHTKHGYRTEIGVFFSFLDQTWPENAPWNGDKVHDDRKISQREDDETKRFKYEDVIVRFASWLHSKRSLYHPELFVSDSTVGTYCIAVRSFFAFMRMPLILNRPQKRAVAKNPSMRNIPYHLTLGDIVAMKHQGNARERYILLVGKSLGLRIGDFVSLRQGLFEGNLKDHEAPYSLGVIMTEKRKQPAYAFLDYEAYQAFLDWKHELQALNKWDGKDGFMLHGTRPNWHITVQEVNSVLKKLGMRAGLRLGNYRLSFHCFRRFLCDHLSTAVGDMNKWKQIVGKQIPESAYISSDNLREAYAKVMQYTCEERTMKLTDASDMQREIAYLQTQIREMKASMQNVANSMPKYLTDLAQDLIAKGAVPVEMVERAKRETEESLVRTKEVMDEAFLKDYALSVRKFEQKTLT